MTLGQKEKHIAAVFSFAHRTTIAAAVPVTYLPLMGGTSLTTEISLVIPQDGTLKNLTWDCQSNGLTGSNNNFKVKVGAAHVSPAVAPSFGPDAISVNIDGKTSGSPVLSFPVFAGQRIAVLVQTTAGAGTVSRMRVSFELEVEKVSEVWQLASDNTTVFYDGGNVGIGTVTPTEKLEVSGSIRIKDGNEGVGKVLTSDANGKGTWAYPPIGFAPLGSIIAWHRNFPNCPPLPNEWVVCNGQTLIDAASPFNNQVIPDLNGEGRFLRGSTTSGTLQADAFQGHKHSEPGHSHYISLHGNGTGSGSWGNYAASGYNTTDQAAASSSVQIQLGDPVDSGTGSGLPRLDRETRPINMSVVWIMRVK